MKSGKSGRGWMVPITILLCILCIVVILISRQYLYGDVQDEEITIAVMQSDNVQDFNSNYYTEWLEGKTGYQIQFEYMQPGYEKEYIDAMLISRNNHIDAVFFPSEEPPITDEEFYDYTRAGLIKELSGLMKTDGYLAGVLKSYQLEDVMQQECGGIYYVPNMDTSRKKHNFQVLWINIGWLKTLGLMLPHTTDELYEVLTAFRDKDPNENGIKDELPMVSCEDDYKLQSYQYLLNAYLYNDPQHMRFYLDEQGEIHFAAEEEAFREGLTYCSLLYQEKLLSNDSFSCHRKQLMEHVNAPEDLVGAFTSQSIADVVYADSEDIIARYVYLPPLEGPDGTENAIVIDYEPRIGGWIPANSKHPEKAYAILETMLSEEASLISEYGEEEVDWNYSESGDLSIYGDTAIVTTLNYLKDKVQNKNFAGAGPQVVAEHYIDGVTWNGDNSLVEYIDVRAVKRYEPFYSINNSNLREMLKKKVTDRNGLKSYMDRMVRQFINGESNINSEEEWNSFRQLLRNYLED